MSKIIYFDGACLPKNPGGVACFGVVATNNGDIVEEKWGVVDEQGTNNIAEWAGLVEAIQMVKELGWDNVKILGDSQLVVNQFNERWKINKEHLLDYFIEAHEECQGLDIIVEWIPRDKNIADPVCHRAFVEHVENQIIAQAKQERDDCIIKQLTHKTFIIINKHNKKKYKVSVDPNFSCSCSFFKKYNAHALLKRSNLKIRCKHFFILEWFLEKHK